MNATVDSTSTSLQQIVGCILQTHKITRSDQQHLMAIAHSCTTLNKEERALINRVFDELRQGRLRIVN